jgi:hypothetical protein
VLEKRARHFERAADERIWLAGLAIVLGFLLVMFLRGIHRPWTEDDNWYGAVYSQAAHNNLRAGVRAAGVSATLYFGPLPIPAEAYYVHHPTLLPLMITAAFAVFGEAEWVARLAPVACSLASVIFLWLFIRRTVGARAATLSAAMFAVLPMELHYGDMVDFEPCLVMWMLATLCSLNRWEVTERRRWAALAAGCALLAMWTDWPGYLFVLSVAASYLLSRSRRWFGVVLVGLVGVSGLFFLFQIRSVNPHAWDDLRAALMMRLGNQIPTGIGALPPSGPQFTASEWFQKIGGDLRGNFLLPTWLLVFAGALRLVLSWRAVPGLRRAGWGAGHLFVAGGLYVVLLKNESFMHDFASFYIIGAVAMLAGLALDAVLAWSSTQPRMLHGCASAGVGALLVALAFCGHRQSEEMRSQCFILDGQTPEPPGLIPALGRSLDAAFPPDTTLLANFDPYGSSLTYYAQRTMLTNLDAAADWKTELHRDPQAGGVIWLGAPNAREITDALPPGKISRIEVDGIAFVLWQPEVRADR